ncbi:MAG: hypothetical protein V4578_16350 [Pseudomonadota bacterium]
MKPAHALKVFLTVDTELWPDVPGWPHRPLPPERAHCDEELAVDIHGLTSAGGFGLPYQIGVLAQHGLRASYFVEALFAEQAGLAPLAHIVGLVQRGGQQVELHLHPEWLPRPADAQPPVPVCQYLCHLPLERQSALIGQGLANLRAAGAAPVHAFRAGSFGGSRVTLQALAHHGIQIDTSYTPSYQVGVWDQPIAQPMPFDGVWEFPVASFRDYPGHTRHAQLCACSHAEMVHALEGAWRAGWYAFVIVLHSFELIRKRGGCLPAPERHLIQRYEQLCAFLGRHRDRFHTSLFSELALQDIPMPGGQAALRSRPQDTLARMARQAWSRIR